MDKWVCAPSDNSGGGGVGNPVGQDRQEIIDFVKSELAPYKQLRGGVEFVDEIPKSASGKILRKELRDRAKKTGVAKL